MRHIATLSLAFALSACAAGQPTEAMLKQRASESARLEKALAGFTPGPAKNCLSSRDIGTPESYDESTILFRTGRNLIYRNETKGSCEDVGDGRALITKSFGSQICAGDIAHVADLSAGFTTDTCSFGKFVPYRRG